MTCQPAKTNYALNPRFAVNTNAVSTYGGGVLSRDTSEFYISPACGLVEVSGAYHGFVLPTASGLASIGETWNGWIKGEIVTGQSIELYMQLEYTDASVDTGSAVICAGTSDWADYEITRAANGAKTLDTIKLLFVEPSTDAHSIRVGAWQIELDEHTNYFDGSMGTGFAWTGAEHGSASTRSATADCTGNPYARIRSQFELRPY